MRHGKTPRKLIRRFKTPRNDECKPPVSGPWDTPDIWLQTRPDLWKAACAAIDARGMMHGEEVHDLCLMYGFRIAGSGELLVKALCHPDGPARYVEYAPSASQLAFGGLGPAAYKAPQVHPAAWYIGRKKYPVANDNGSEVDGGR